MVALEIIISTAIQINPLAAESRQATVIPQGAGRTAICLKTDTVFQTAPIQSCQQHTQRQAAISAHSWKLYTGLELEDGLDSSRERY